MSNIECGSTGLGGLLIRCVSTSLSCSPVHTQIQAGLLRLTVAANDALNGGRLSGKVCKHGDRSCEGHGTSTDANNPANQIYCYREDTSSSPALKCCTATAWLAVDPACSWSRTVGAAQTIKSSVHTHNTTKKTHNQLFHLSLISVWIDRRRLKNTGARCQSEVDSRHIVDTANDSRSKICAPQPSIDCSSTTSTRLTHAVGLLCSCCRSETTLAISAGRTPDVLTARRPRVIVRS